MTHPTLDATTLAARLDGPAAPLVIDVRSAAEFASVHIRGSYHVPLPLLAEHTEEFARRMGVDDTDGTEGAGVVLVCQSGQRAGQALGLLDAVGLSGAAILDGGIAGARDGEIELVRGAGPWAMDRQVRMAAGSLVLTGLIAGRLLSPRARLLSAAIASGLVYSAASNTCGLAAVLARMPWNTRVAADPSLDGALAALPSSR